MFILGTFPRQDEQEAEVILYVGGSKMNIEPQISSRLIQKENGVRTAKGRTLTSTVSRRLWREVDPEMCPFQLTV